MTDIVERLRRGDPCGDCKRDRCACVIMEDAADEITALRAENEKLRAALRDAAEQMEWLAKKDPHCMGWVGPLWPSTTPAIKVAAEKARAALGEKS